MRSWCSVHLDLCLLSSSRGSRDDMLLRRSKYKRSIQFAADQADHLLDNYSVATIWQSSKCCCILGHGGDCNQRDIRGRECLASWVQVYNADHTRCMVMMERIRRSSTIYHRIRTSRCHCSGRMVLGHSFAMYLLIAWSLATVGGILRRIPHEPKDPLSVNYKGGWKSTGSEGLHPWSTSYWSLTISLEI
jgi:hypothetical protein